MRSAAEITNATVSAVKSVFNEFMSKELSIQHVAVT